MRALSNPATTSSEVCALLAPWVVFLQRAVTEGAISTGDARLPGGYLDCVPWNLHEDPGSRELTYAGAEWDYLPPLNVSLPFVHGMINLALFMDACSVAEVLRTVPYGDLLMAAAERLGIVLTRRDLAAALEAEADWVSVVLPVDRGEWLERITSLMEAPLASPPTLPQVLGRYQARLAKLHASAEAASGAQERATPGSSGRTAASHRAWRPPCRRPRDLTPAAGRDPHRGADAARAAYAAASAVSGSCTYEGPSDRSEKFRKMWWPSKSSTRMSSVVSRSLVMSL